MEGKVSGAIGCGGRCIVDPEDFVTMIMLGAGGDWRRLGLV